MGDKQPKNEHSQRPDQGLEDLFRIRRDLSILHKAAYIGIVFLGLVLAWYGVWTAVSEIWPLNNPAVATVAGVLLLIITGKVKDLL
jgi:hypothetical protein